VPDPAATSKTPQPGDEQPPADVRLSSFRSWDEFAGWFGTLASAAPDAVVQAKAAALTAGAADEGAKLAAIYRYVSTEIRYVSLSFGLGRFAAHPPADVLAHQYGDCKDKAVLLQALLDAVGVRTVPILINTGRSIADDFASPLEFDHMIALAPRGPDLLKGAWMDATAEVAPLGMLISPIRDKRALLIDDRTHGRVVRTPADPPFASVERVDLDGMVNRIGVLSAKATYTLRGDSELVFRAIVRAAPSSALKDVVTAVAGENGLDGDISDVSTTDPGETTNPFVITFHMRKRGYLDWAAPQSEMAGLPTIKLGYSRDEDRKDMDRIPLGSPRTVRLHASVELPPGYDIDAPQPVKGTKAGLAYSSTYRADGGRLFLDRELVVDAKDVPASSFGEYSALAVMAAADAAQRFKVRGHAIGAPEVPADATADEIYSAAYSAYEAKRYDVAVTLWKRNTEMAPKMGSAWDALGLAYGKLKKYDEAAAAIQQQIALDPYDRRAYKDLGGVLKDAGKKEAAAAAFAKHAELNTLDGDAFKELGQIYNSLNRFPEAAAALEKAAGLLKKDPWVHADLASAYLRMKEVDKARRAIETVMAASPDVALRTKVAWQLAEAGVDLDRADELARGAEKEIGDATQRLDLKSLGRDHLDLVERLAWLWDTLGWIQFQKGNSADAERYVHAAWQLAGQPDVAFHLGQIYEKRSRLADALSFYLTAQALTSNPTSGMIAHVKKLSGGGALPIMLQSAKQMAPADRMFTVPDKGDAGAAYFLAIVGSDRRPLEVRFSTGSENLHALGETALKRVGYPVEFPADSPVRLVLGIRLTCDAQRICRGIVDYPWRVELPK
jgi:tetratricopeptide (TPR) repeat protein